MRYFTSALAAGIAALFLAGTANAAPKTCPPGLAKKAVPCVPPGQVGKTRGNEYDARYREGDIIRIGDFEVIRDPQRYGLDRNGSYYRSGDYVFRVNGETREVLDLIGAVAAILN